MYKLKLILAIALVSMIATLTTFRRSLEPDATPVRNLAHQSALSMQLTPQAGYTYRYSYYRKIHFTGLGSAFEPVEYQGHFEIQTVMSDPSGFSAVIHERDARLRLEWSHLTKDLKVYSDGTKAVQNERVSILKDLVSLWLFPIEEDTVGQYKSILTQVNATESVNKIKKTKTEYLGNVDYIPEILNSSHILSWNPALGIPLIVEGEEVTRMQANVQGESSYRLQLTDIIPASKQADEVYQQLQTATSLAILEDEPTKENLPEYAAIRWPELKQKLKRVDQMESQEQLQVFGELMRALQIGKAKVSDLMALIWNPKVLRAGVGSQLFKTVVGALASFGTPEAQASIVAVYQSPEVPVSGKGAVLTSLTTMQSPLASETKAFLASTMQSESNRNLASGAGFALSSSQDAAHSDAVYSSVSGAWAQSGTSGVSEKLNALDMIGNTGNEKFFPDLMGILSNEQSSSEMKAKAVFAMRFMHSDVAITELTARLFDSEAVVREAALDAIELQPKSENIKSALAGCALKETNTHLRDRCASLQ